MAGPDGCFEALCRYTKALAVALSERDPHTRLHCARVVDIAEALARACGLSEREVTAVRVSASFHDIGKIGIPDHILLKPGRLDPEEWVLMKAHAEKGQRIILATELAGADEVGLSIRHHHERYDGQGYPDGLAGESIPLAARILAISDSYDAMGTPRPYHRPRSHREILRVLHEEDGGKLDPLVFARFLRMIDTSPTRVP